MQGEPSSPSGSGSTTPIHHVFILIKENHAFENYFGTLPGVIGYPPNASLPVSFGSSTAVHPFPIDASSTPDLPHDHASELVDLDHGRNDLFVAQAAADGFPDPSAAAGYYTASQIPQYFAYAKAYALDDMFFSGVLGPTLPNRIFDLSATNAGVLNDTPPPLAQLAVPTILDQLESAHVPWAYDYLGDPTNLTPFLFPSVAGNPCLADNVVPFSSFPGQLASAQPPAVTFIDPSHDHAGVSEHPAENVTLGAEWTTGVINAIFSSPDASGSAVLLFYDEAGGYWDPVTPPAEDSAGDGFRVPFLVLSPFTPAGLVTHETLDPASVISFIDSNFGLPALNPRVAEAASLSGFFNFSAPPRPPTLLQSPFDFNASSSPLVGGEAKGVAYATSVAPPSIQIRDSGIRWVGAVSSGVDPAKLLNPSPAVGHQWPTVGSRSVGRSRCCWSPAGPSSRLR
ncbi:MAG TPA: alkaline phosphatase family protein [Thermoplasmata archaeon]|nr:alkaline phosphatase family protein [Thermoplasmata archaeon]